MHVAVDVRFAVLDDRGIGRATRALLAQLRRDPQLALTFVAAGRFVPRRRIATVLGVDARAIAARVPADAALLWSPSNGTDLPAGVPCLTTVHDVVPLAFPATAPAVRAREQAPLRRTAERARGIVTPSAFMAGQIAERLGFARERIAVVPHGVAPPFGPAGAAYVPPDGRPYVLHVGAHDARKNVATLVAAWQRAFPDRTVALAFTRPPASLPPGAVVVDAGSDEQLAALYRGARLVAIPSLDEGFGLPLLEALASGAPVLASRVAALPEVGGDAAAWIEAPRDVAAWAHALACLSGDPPALAALAAAGPLRAAAFTWERSAAQLSGVFRACVTSA